MSRAQFIKSNRKVIAKQQVQEGTYWREKLMGLTKVACFPSDTFQPKSQEEIVSPNYKFSEDLWEQVKKVSNNNDHALHVVLASAVTVLLYKYTGLEDIVIGQPVPNPQSENLMNDSLVVRSRLEADMTFKDLLIQMRQTVLDAAGHQNYPMDVLAEELELKTTSGENPFFETGVQLENIHVSTFKEVPPFLFSFIKEESGITLRIKYNSVSYRQETIDRVVSHFFRVLEQVLSNLETNLLEVVLLTVSDNKWVINYNKTKLNFDSNLIMGEFEVRAAQRPTALAIVCDDIHLTYQDLNARANRLARTLRDKGVQPDGMVPIIAERSVEMIVGIFAILKAGGAYIPINPKDPLSRVKYFLEDSHAEVVLTQSKFMDILEDGYEKINLDDDASYADDQSDLVCVNRETDLAYVIYTSGSTGKPKGVMVEHSNLNHILTALEERYPFESEDCYLLKTPFTFDVSVSEVFGWIRGGGHLVILEPEAEKDPDKLLSVLGRSNVTHVNFVPALLNVFTQQLENRIDRSLPALKYVMVAGEALPIKVAYNFKEMLEDVCLENLYGPTEITIYATNYPVVGDFGHRSIPIGKPLPNVQAYIVNEKLNLQPIGVTGELCISGSGVARGYLNRHELSDEKFVPCPWQPGMKMYRTGDMVRWQSNGDIEYLGRIDHQVKIRGYRIELEEIERVLMEHPSVQEALTIVHEDKVGDKSLVMYVVQKAKNKIQSTELRQYLKGILPEYMVPSACMFLEAFPLNQNGKVDRQALPDPVESSFELSEYVAPRNTVEQVITDVWCEVLGNEKVGVHDNFFTIGGHSLLATTVVYRLRSALNTELSMQTLFEHPSVAKLALVVEGNKKTPIKNGRQRISKLSRESHLLN
ncbi:non-ribosomal peptide synthetase [Bacillus sp. 2205SS5-2]|uniref:non-ribosomal peptide synthetase n=1 Tax=Bacillus sp. 2205SS5-2 TaxID=3109031 RepID=UPI003005B83C